MFTGNEPGNEKLTADEMIQDCNLKAQTKIQALTDKITSYTDILKIFNWEMLADLSDTANVIVTKSTFRLCRTPFYKQIQRAVLQQLPGRVVQESVLWAVAIRAVAVPDSGQTTDLWRAHDELRDTVLAMTEVVEAFRNDRRILDIVELVQKVYKFRLPNVTYTGVWAINMEGKLSKAAPGPGSQPQAFTEAQITAMEQRVAQASAILPMEIRLDVTVKFLGRLAMEKLGGDITVGIDSYMQRTKAKYDRMREDQGAQMADNTVLGHSSATISTAESLVMTGWDSFNATQINTDSDDYYAKLDPRLQIDWQYRTTEHD
ncbi:hypothetical protein COL154_007466 [Colletotrichum chrysophilum]|uniref:Uncharacterized protein n=1 Tax=Colletotrichum chrysophilum TaxID=1836956 RepID=A0AAD9A2M2_9PEZI|nr:hypothetical protein KNSL1_007164 [Colletotrichum chrysophilum]KAJ0360547.1 hypothetical protein COL154_007466 [Colletotrichum chrysophilum]KAK1839017.1 hypothetical protein CCHR01_18360 [Colletotrichum chrysophilum]